MTTKTEIILKGPDDWPKWDSEFKAKAVAMDLWDYVKEETPEALFTKPPMPDPETFKAARPPAQATRSQSATPPVSVGLDADESRNFQIAWNIYTRRANEYDAQRSSTKDLKDWVRRTIAQQYLDSSCDPTESLHQWYKKLKEHASAGKAADQKVTRDRYKDAVKPLNKPPKDWNVWISTWEEVMSLGIQKDLAEAKKGAVWFHDFLDAVRPIIPNWALTYRLNKGDKAEEGTLSYRTLANDFRKEIPSGAKGGKSYAKGSFGVTYGTDQPEKKEDEAEETGDASSSHAQKSRKASNKRARKSTTASSQDKCPACELPGHKLSDCFYVFEEKAFEGFKPRKQIQKRTEENLKKEEVIAAVNQLKRKKPKDEENQDD